MLVMLQFTSRANTIKNSYHNFVGVDVFLKDYRNSLKLLMLNDIYDKENILTTKK
ncbi:MAG: hypothetical protein LBR15_06245 [Methanobrevibacter sp.]|nr:hypothetical protein [Candidatus Methanovirga australis]